MLRFLVVVDGIDKVRAFSKLITPLCEFNPRGNVVITLREDVMIVYRPPDSVRTTSMFQLNVHPNEAFSTYLFEYDDGEEIAFEVSAEQLGNLFGQHANDTEKLSITLNMVGETPFLHVETEPQDKDDNLNIVFQQESEFRSLVAPETAGDSLHVTFPEPGKLQSVLNSIRYMDFTKVELIGDTKGIVKLKAAGEQAQVEVGIRDLPVEIKSDDETVEIEDGEPMSATVEVRALVNFIRITGAANHCMKIVFNHRTALRAIVEQTEGFLTLYLPHIGL
ncbi:hypothetical protein M3Y94_01314100 [Aphelenchoides besseyi]|nr:hypothetical protein M3Y94_01314100 [Aphelenchoides besseyi]KAI6220299.1 hypothetical protein M3Y95_01070500 [Aphelenchoides besseyi]